MIKKTSSFDSEVLRWDSLYEEENKQRRPWGIFQRSLQKRAKKRVEICLSLIFRYNPTRVLDLGCGVGYYGLKILNAGFSWCGLDISMEMLERCKERFSQFKHNPPLILGTFLQLPFVPNYYDIILIIGVLSYHKKCDIERGLKEIISLMKPCGIIITQSISFDIITWIRSRLPLFFPRPIRVPGPLYPYNPKTIKNTLRVSGFSVLDTITLYKYKIIPAGWIYVAQKHKDG